MDDQRVHPDDASASASDAHTNVPRRIIAIVGICLAIVFTAYVLLSGRTLDALTDAAGARPKSSFDALWFADPSVASRAIPRGTPVRVVISNQSRGAQTFHWSTSSSGSTLQRGSIHVPRASTRTFVVRTGDAQPGQWFWIRLDGLSVAIKAKITS